MSAPERPDYLQRAEAALEVLHGIAADPRAWAARLHAAKGGAGSIRLLSCFHSSRGTVWPEELEMYAIRSSFGSPEREARRKVIAATAQATYRAACAAWETYQRRVSFDCHGGDGGIAGHHA